MLPGTTVLFGFLLSVPFATGSATLTTFDRVTFFIAFLGAGLAMVSLLAEAGYQRLRGKPYDKQGMIRTATHQAIAALVTLGISLIAGVVLVANWCTGPPSHSPWRPHSESVRSGCGSVLRRPDHLTQPFELARVLCCLALRSPPFTHFDDIDDPKFTGGTEPP